jgi:hypothetical protein
MPELNPRPESWQPDSRFFSLMFGKDLPQQQALEKRELEKLSLFEKRLEKELFTTDSIHQAVTKIVKTALAAEFGPSILASAKSQPMVETIVSGIMGDPVLRKQSLIIIDKFAKEPIEGEN